MSTPLPNAIEIASVSKIYRLKTGLIRAVDNLTLSIPTGTMFAFLGPNGAGKTTSIKMICGLIEPSEGHILLNGYDNATLRAQAMTQIGVVLEGARNIHWRLSAWENLLYFGRLRGHSNKRLQDYAEQLLRDLQLWERRNDPVRLFSRGMQQKIAIACALVCDPPILLLDEPTLGLDLESAKALEKWLGTLVRDRGKTVLLTTHQLDLAERLADQVAVINKGRLIVDKPVSELISLFQRPRYRIRLGGYFTAGSLPELKDNEVIENDGETVITVEVDDNHALYSLLAKLENTGVPLIAVNRDEPTLEEVFLRLLHEEQAS